jgi:hypothetical protein
MRDNVFTMTEFNRPEQSRFDLSHNIKYSFQMGELIPTLVMECIPGDKFEISAENMLRFAPLIAPVMHRVKADIRFFFVPTRILWPGWEDYITGQEDTLLPFISAVDVAPGTVADYLGIPTDVTLELRPLAFQYAAYLRIYDDYYRDQNLVPEQFINPLISGANIFYEAGLEGPPLRSAWMHDYFTSCLPFPQAGADVSLPLVAQQEIEVQSRFRPGGENQNAGFWRFSADGIPQDNLLNLRTNVGPVPNAAGTEAGVDGYVYYDPNGTLFVDVQADAVNINTLRRAIALQEWLELNARGGRRYNEHILAHFGVRTSDGRLQRAEYIGGQSQLMAISEVLATASNEAENIPVGYMGGHGISYGGGNTFTYYCEEHGYIMGIIRVLPDTAYQQGLHRQFDKRSRYDFAWPTFAHIGEQPVFTREIYASAPDPNEVFGYIPRYSEYRYLNDRVCGDFRETLEFWHLGRIFDEKPVLNADFITANPATRIFAVEDENQDHIWAQTRFNILATRKLPRYGVPTI